MIPKRIVRARTLLWSQSEDDFLFREFMHMSDGAMEASLQTKSKTEIKKRRQQLGLIRPKIIKGKNSRIQELVFKLERGQRIFGAVRITGGNNDADFGFFTYQGNSDSKLRSANIERISGSTSFSHDISVSGNYCFYFSNSYSVRTAKIVEFHYQLGGKELEVRMSFSI